LPDLTGKVVIVTGGNAGLGLEAAKALLAKGAHVIIASRDHQKVEQAVNSLRSAFPQAKVEGMHLDLSNIKSVKTFAEEFLAKKLPLHVLVNNAAVFCPPYARTAEGVEISLGVNHYGTYHLTQLLRPALKAAAPSRVVYVNSGAAEMSPKTLDWADLKGLKATDSGNGQYALSKLYTFMAAAAESKELRDQGISTLIVNPGLVNTGIQLKSVGWIPWIFLQLARLFGQTPAQGAKHILYAAAHPDAVGSKDGPDYLAVTPRNGMTGPTAPWVVKHPMLKDAEASARMLAETRRIVAELTEQVPVGQLSAQAI